MTTRIPVTGNSILGPFCIQSLKPFSQAVINWVGIAPPYHFTENLQEVGDWVLPAIIVVSGSFLNFRYTSRLPLLLAWVGGFKENRIFDLVDRGMKRVFSGGDDGETSPPFDPYG